MNISQRIQAVQMPIIPVIARLIRNNPGTISLGQGVVYYGPPPATWEQIVKFYAVGENHQYKSVIGIPQLRDQIAKKLAQENHITINNTNDIVVTAGSNMGFLNAVMAIADPGDEIIIQKPYYFNHEMAITMLNCHPVIVSTDTNYHLDLEAIERAITPKTRAIVTISPNNPTGVVYPAQSIIAVNKLCAKYQIYHINDEAYEYFTYDGIKHFSPAALLGSSPHTISLFTLSKAYGFASWRIGYMVIPHHLLESIEKIQDTNLICPPVISQYAAIGALQTGVNYCHAKQNAIALVRKIAIEELAKLADFCLIPPTQGAFYFMIKVNTAIDSLQLVQRLIAEHQIAVIPGNTFGMDKGCYLRVAYGALQQDTAISGINRLVQGLQTICRQ